MPERPQPDPAVAAAMLGQMQQQALLQLRTHIASHLLGFLLVGHVANPRDPDLDDQAVRLEIAGQAVEWGDELVRVVLRTPFRQAAPEARY